MQCGLLSDMPSDKLMMADEAEALKNSHQNRGDGWLKWNVESS